MDGMVSSIDEGLQGSSEGSRTGSREEFFCLKRLGKTQ